MLNQLRGGKQCSLEVIHEMPPLAVFEVPAKTHFTLIDEQAVCKVTGSFSLCFTPFQVIDLPRRMQQKFQIRTLKHTVEL